jgi:hypothetical protein
LSQSRRADDNVCLCDITARVELFDEVFYRFDTRIGMTLLQPFSFDQTVSQSGKNSNIFSLASQLSQHRRRSFMWQNTFARFDEKRENGSILLVLEEMAGQDGLYVNERDAIEVCFQIVCVQRFQQQFLLRSRDVWCG